MGYPINAEILQGIVEAAFYTASSDTATVDYVSDLAVDIQQDKLTETYISFGSVPEPTQLSGKSAGKLIEGKELKDYKLTVTLLEWEDTVDMPRVVLESNPGEGARVAAGLAYKTRVFFNKRMFTQFVNNPTGYDGVAMFGTTHPESGTNQTNAISTNIAAAGNPFTPTVAELETSLTTMIAGLKNFTDDQGSPVNETAMKFTAFIPPDFEWVFKTATDPKMGPQAVDSSGGTGRFRGVVDYRVSAFCTATGAVGGNADRFYLVADNGRTKPLAYCHQVPWEFKSNIGSDADSWNQNKLALMFGYSIWEIAPWDWKTIFRQIYT